MTFQAPVGTFTHNLVRNVSYPWGLIVAVAVPKWGVERAGGLREEEHHRPCTDSSLNTYAALSKMGLLSQNPTKKAKSPSVLLWWRCTRRWHLAMLLLVGTPHNPGLKAKRQTQTHCSRFHLSWKLRREGWGGGSRIGRKWGCSKAFKCRMWEDDGNFPKLQLGRLCLDNCLNAGSSFKQIS